MDTQSPPIYFDNFDSLWRVLAAVPVLYLAVVLFIRVSGKRSTSQMNSFDWIVTVAMGSLLASPILLKDVVVAEALLAIASLLALQWVVTAIVVRWDRAESLVKARPTLLVYRGEWLEAALRRERVTRQEVMAALRERGSPALKAVYAVVLESDARLSVLSMDECGDCDGVEVIQRIPGSPGASGGG